MKRLMSWCIGILASLSVSFAFALNIDKVKVNFLSGEYKAAIMEGEKILATEGHSPDADELYYILGLSYLKDRNYLRASDIFEIILKEFNKSALKEEAKLGLGDTYFLRGDFDKAQAIYQELLKEGTTPGIKPQLYYRLSENAFKKGDTQIGQEYLTKLKSEFPQNMETRFNKDLAAIPDSPAGFYYTVQVGYFSSGVNAGNLTQKLIREGYPAYVEESVSSGQAKMYRVKVGKLPSREEASLLEKKLSEEGYPTKIYP